MPRNDTSLEVHSSSYYEEVDETSDEQCREDYDNNECRQGQEPGPE